MSDDNTFWPIRYTKYPSSTANAGLERKLQADLNHVMEPSPIRNFIEGWLSLLVQDDQLDVPQYPEYEINEKDQSLNITCTLSQFVSFYREDILLYMQGTMGLSKQNADRLIIDQDQWSRTVFINAITGMLNQRLK